MHAREFNGWVEEDIREELAHCHSTNVLAEVYEQALGLSLVLRRDENYIPVLIAAQEELGKREEWSLIVKKFKEVHVEPKSVLFVEERGTNAKITKSLIDIAISEKRSRQDQCSVIEQELLCPAGIVINL
ncbi:hypothetical protein IKF34_01575 [Candidatus Saccharibacteria bacterium]|nr:hypothetical protein [Candidatus Saccharibacteria bacterium]